MPRNLPGSLPLVKSSLGLPIGVQCAARFGEDALLFRLAAQLESEFIGTSPMVTARPAL